jgi:peptide/nickel transport system substrate-binding protein
MSWGYMPEVGQLLAAQWAELGISVDSRVLSYPEALALAGDGSHQVMPFTLSASDPDILRRFFHSEGSFNWSAISDPELDEWLDAGAQTPNGPERDAIYSQVQLRVMDLALAIPIRDYVNLNAVDAQVEGLRYDAQGWFPWLIDVTANP